MADTGNNSHNFTYGSEIEKVFSSISGEPYPVGSEYFENLQSLSISRGDNPDLSLIGGKILGITNSIGCETLDNSYILGESSVWPAVSQDEGGLNKLNEVLTQQLSDVLNALEPLNATVTNMANHPLVEITDENYIKYVAPKPVYSFMQNVRGWDHKAGIDAKAQNSPSVGVNAEYAVDALNCSLGISAAIIAIYANSPFKERNLADHKESRLNLWSDMFSGNFSAGDMRTINMPERPFNNFKDYIKWMFGDDTSMYFVVLDKYKNSKDEKGDVAFLKIDGNPSLLQYIKKDEWKGIEHDTDQHHTVIPNMSHFEAMQFTQFSGARIRYKFKDEMPTVEEFNDSLHGSDDAVDKFFATHSKYIYIEQREPGANFPDQEILSYGEDIAKSVVISPAAIYAGIINNLSATKKLLNEYGWANLRNLREVARKDGLDAKYERINAKDLCEDVIKIAHDGLADNEKWMLAYPEHVLRSGQNGADRALKRYEKLNGSPAERIAQIVTERAIVLP